MRHEPVRVHGVTRETAAELIVKPARRHAIASMHDHRSRFVIAETLCTMQQQRRHARLRKLGRIAEPAILFVERLLEQFTRAADDFRCERFVCRRLLTCGEFKARGDLVGRRGDFDTALAPDIADLLQHGKEAAATVAFVGRKICAAEKRFQFWREKNIQRPAAAARGALHERHVNLVHIRTLLAIHFDAHKMFTQKRADLFVLERFTLHHMAPMAGRVADA